jgi:DNA polymerase-3 subunit epsilon
MPQRPIYYDTETTGTRSDKDRIIEIAAFDPVQNRTFVHLVNPATPIPPEATAIHNITDAMVANSPSWKEVGQMFIEFCGADCVLIAHNNDSFDKLFLENEYKRAGLDIPKWPYIDSLKWSRKYRNDLPRHTLQSLREVYGITANQAHRALDDVLVLHQVFSYMIDDLTMEQVQELMSTPMNVSRMPFGKHQGKPLNLVPADYVKWLAGSGALDKNENQTLKEAFEKLGLLQVT